MFSAFCLRSFSTLWLYHRNTDREHILNILLVLPILQIMTIYTHRIHGTSIFTCIWLMFMVNVGEYTSPMDPIGYTMMQSSQYFAWTNSGYLGESFTETTVLVLEYIETSPRHLELHTWLTYKPKRPPNKYLWLTGRVHILRQLGFPGNMSFNELDTKFFATKWIDLWIASWWEANV